MEPHVVRIVFPWPGPCGGDTEKGGKRILVIPNIVDRVAQTVAVLALEPELEKVFHDDSFGYRPGRSALDAVAVCRERCFKSDWVIDMDIKAFFDSMPWDLTQKAVAHHTDSKWVLIYVERWLKAPMLMPDGILNTGQWEPRKVVQFRRYSLISSFTTVSMLGWHGNTRSCHSSGMQTT